MIRIIAAAATLAVTTLPAIATNAGVPNAVIDQYASTRAGTFESREFYAIGSGLNTGEQAWSVPGTTQAGSPDLTVGISGGLGRDFFYAETDLFYFVEFFGPGSSVDVDVSALGYGNGGPGALPGSQGAYYGGGVAIGGGPSACFSNDNPDCSASSFSMNGVYSLPTNTVLQVELSAYVYAYAPLAQFDTASAYVDPTFAVDANQADASAYSIAYSARYAPSAVPEPSGIALMMAGLGALGLARRRRA